MSVITAAFSTTFTMSTTVRAATVNHQPWYPGWPETYVVAIVELDEQPGLRLATNLVGDVPADPRRLICQLPLPGCERSVPVMLMNNCSAAVADSTACVISATAPSCS